jgi:hypothetical protein
LISAVVVPGYEPCQDEAPSSLLLGRSHIVTGNVFLSTQEIATEKEVPLGIVLMAIELTACYIGGLDIDTMNYQALNKGARVVFFNNADENELKMRKKLFFFSS